MLNTYDVRFELNQGEGKKPAVRKGFCVMSDKFAAKFAKTAQKKPGGGELALGQYAREFGLTFFSEKGVKTTFEPYLSAWPVGQEPINLFHWRAFIIVKDGYEWKVLYENEP